MDGTPRNRYDTVGWSKGITEWDFLLCQRPGKPAGDDLFVMSTGDMPLDDRAILFITLFVRSKDRVFLPCIVVFDFRDTRPQ